MDDEAFKKDTEGTLSGFGEEGVDDGEEADADELEGFRVDDGEEKEEFGY